MYFIVSRGIGTRRAPKSFQLDTSAESPSMRSELPWHLFAQQAEMPACCRNPESVHSRGRAERQKRNHSRLFRSPHRTRHAPFGKSEFMKLERPRFRSNSLRCWFRDPRFRRTKFSWAARGVTLKSVANVCRCHCPPASSWEKNQDEMDHPLVASEREALERNVGESLATTAQTDFQKLL